MTHDTKTRPLILAGVVCLLMFEAGVLLAGFPQSLAGNGDFSAFYRTAVMVRSGELHTLYDPAAQDRFDRRVFPSLQRNPPYYYYHPPYEALLLLPLAFVSYRTAFWCWTATGFGLLLSAGHVLESEFPELRRATGIPFSVLCLAFFPVTMIFLQGQDSPILLLLVTLAFRQFERKQDVFCGTLLGLSLFKFQFILPLVAILTFRWRPKLIGAFLGAAIAMFSLSWILVGNSGLKFYWQLLSHGTPEMVWRMPNLRGLVESLGGSPALTIMLSLLFMLWSGVRVIRNEAGAFAAAVVCAELVSYHGHVYDAVLLLLPILWALNRTVHESGSPWDFWPALFFLMLPAYVLLTRYKATWIIALPFVLLAFLVSRPTKTLSGYRMCRGEALP